MSVAGGTAGGEFRIKLSEDNVEDKGGKDRAERAPLGKTFALAEAVPERVGHEVPASVGICIERVEKWNKGVENVVA
jgi:hypothetical protein